MFRSAEGRLTLVRDIFKYIPRREVILASDRDCR